MSDLRLVPTEPIKIGDYDLDAINIDDDLDFRLELGKSMMIYWALPAAPGDRLRLALVDSAVVDIDEPILEADPFLCDLPRLTITDPRGSVTVEVTGGTYRVEIEKDGKKAVRSR